MKVLTFNSTSVSSENVLFSISMLQTPFRLCKYLLFGSFGSSYNIFLVIKQSLPVSIFTVIENKTYVRKNLGASSS